MPASVLSTVLDQFRTKLALAVGSGGAGLTNLDVNQATEDGTGSVHQKFRLMLATSPTATTKLFGGGVVEYETEVRLEVYWDPESREATVWNTAADDLTNACGVMQKSGYRPAGCVLIKHSGHSEPIDQLTPKKIQGAEHFTVTTRETQDLT